MKYAIACFATAAMACMSGACTTSGARVEPSEEPIILIDWLAEYEKSYAALLEQFSELAGVHGEGHEKFLIVVQPTFEEWSLVAVEQRPAIDIQFENGTTHLNATTEIRVSSWGLSREPKFDNGNREHTRIVKDFYSREISDAEFLSIFDALWKSGFEQYDTFREPNGCTDGTQIFVEAIKAGERRFFTRHDCDDGYREDLAFTRRLYEFALVAMPEASTHVREAWNHLSKEPLPHKHSSDELQQQ